MVLLWSALLPMAMVGCGRAEKLDLLPVEGVATLDAKPLAGATVFLIPDGLTGQSACGTTGQDGSFRLTTRGRDGASPGTHKVIVGHVAPQASGAPVRDIVKEEMMARQKRASLAPTPPASIPPVYSDVVATPLRCTLPIQGKLLLDLHSQGR